MKLRFSPLPLTLSVLLLSCAAVVNADFDLYSGYLNIATIPSIEKPYYGLKWFVFDGEPDCDMAWRVGYFADTDDVSGTKLGIRCGGTGCMGNTDPASIGVLEMHFSNNPLYHWTIYQNRGSYDMIGLDGKVYGNCDPFPGDDFWCSHAVTTISARRKFRCYSRFTAGDINRCC